GRVSLFKKHDINSGPPAPASTAAYLIGLDGPASDQQVLETRLKRWREEWSPRKSEADANLQGRIESELITALTQGKSWQLSPERIQELRQSCITQICQRNFQFTKD